MAQQRGQERESQRMTGTTGQDRGGRATTEPKEVLEELQRERESQNKDGGRQQGRGNRRDLKTAGIRVGGPSGRGPAPTSGDSGKTPGVSGRPMNRRGSADEIEEEVAEYEASGSQSGGTRKVAVTNKKNKRRAA